MSDDDLKYDDEGKSDKEILFEAMQRARDKFEEHIGSYNLDPAFFDLHMRGYTMDQEFEPIEEIIDKANFENRKNLRED